MIGFIRVNHFILVVLCPLVLACGGTPDSGPAPSETPKADLVLRGGAVYTLDSARTWAEAIAIQGDEIVYVGSDEGVGRFTSPRTRVVDLRGAMVLPGFQDAHVHTIGAGNSQLTLSLHELLSPEDYLDAIGNYAKDRPALDWIVGGGWYIGVFEGEYPNRHLLDAVVSDRPVALMDGDGHTLWANSKALELAGIARDTPDPVNGRIDRDPVTGEPTGSLQEDAMSLVLSLTPPVEPEQMQAAARLAISILNGYGITAFQDAIAMVSGPEAFGSLNAYRALDERGELNARVVTSLWWNAGEGEEQIAQLLSARAEYTKGRLYATSAKIMQDGVFENRTASLLEPYIGTASGLGHSNLTPEALDRAVQRLDAEGFQVHFHAIGDRAIRECLDAVGAAIEANGDRDRRHHISHLELIDPSDIPRFRELGVVANFQPLWAYAEPSIIDLTIPVIGEERGRWIYPIGSVLRSGAIVAFGSDWDVSSPNPLEEIEVAITRRDPNSEQRDGKSWLPEQRISLADALAAFTRNAAYVNFLDDRTGSIEVGKLADLAVIDRNLFEIHPSEISDAKVILTLLGGQPVHGDLAAMSVTH
jgi:predicted amidohydrolase YtcJ